MSHLLHTANRMEGKCILSIPCKQVVPPRYRKILRESQSLNHLSKQDMYQEEVILRHLCSKLTHKQLTKLKIQNELNLRKQFKKIKRKMRQTCKIKPSEVLKCFQGNNQRENLSSILCSQIENIQIGNKYQSKIVNKLMMIKEVNQIQQNKQQYRKLVNSHYNSPLNSPNYKKMNYFIQKINKGEKKSSFDQPVSEVLKSIKTISPKHQNQSNKQNNLPSPKYQRCSDKTGMNPTIVDKMCNQNYSRKLKFHNFRIKDL